MLDFNSQSSIATIAVFFLVCVSFVVVRAWKGSKSRDDAQRAIERLKNLEYRKPLDPADIEALVQEILKQDVKPDLEQMENRHLRTQVEKVDTKLHRQPQHFDEIDALIDEILEPHNPGDPKPVNEAKPVFATPLQTLPDPARSNSKVQSDLPLEPGTKIQAVRNLGSVKKGTPGIIIAKISASYFGLLPSRYQCTFANNIRTSARPKQIQTFDHPYNLEALEDPDFTSILSRQMMLKAQQMFAQSRHHVTARPNIPCVTGRQSISA